MNFERLRRMWYARAKVDDIERPSRDGDLLLNEFGARSHDAKDVGFASEMADAARAILEHPELPRRARAIWRRHCDGKTYSQIAAEVHCSFGKVSEAIDLAQRLMLKPNWEEHMRPPKKLKTTDEPFVDIEATIQMGLEVAHRKIVELHSKPEVSSDDIADNERAVHTLLAVRRSELEYLKSKQPPYPPAPEDHVKGFISAAAKAEQRE